VGWFFLLCAALSDGLSPQQGLYLVVTNQYFCVCVYVLGLKIHWNIQNKFDLSVGMPQFKQAETALFLLFFFINSVVNFARDRFSNSKKDAVR
jgi:hypothetical protein